MYKFIYLLHNRLSGLKIDKVARKIISALL